MSNIDKGKEGENRAAEYLKNAGFEIIERNYRYGHGEIDIVAKDGEYLVFVEVKTRTSDAFGSPLYAITYGKQKQIARVAQGYLYEKKIANVPCRFDVVGVEFIGGKLRLEHIPNAFTMM